MLKINSVPMLAVSQHTPKMSIILNCTFVMYAESNSSKEVNYLNIWTNILLTMTTFMNVMCAIVLSIISDYSVFIKKCTFRHRKITRVNCVGNVMGMNNLNFYCEPAIFNFINYLFCVSAHAIC